MVTRINQFEAKQDLAEQLFEFLRSVIAIVEKTPGCISCELLRSVDDPAQLAIIERWDSIEDHRNAAKAIPREKMAEAMALFARPPSGTYYE